MIVMEAFSGLLKKTESGGFLLSWHVRGRGGDDFQIFHLFFADDTLVFWRLLKTN